MRGSGAVLFIELLDHTRPHMRSWKSALDKLQQINPSHLHNYTLDTYFEFACTCLSICYVAGKSKLRSL